MRVDVEGESPLVPGRIARSHCVLIVDHRLHIHSLFGAVDDIIVTPIDVSHAALNEEKTSVGSREAGRVALRSVQETDGCIAGASR